MILSARPSFLRSHFSESRDLVAARVAVRSLLSRLDVTSQSLRNEIAHRVVQQIGRGSEEIPSDVKDLHAEAASLESLRKSAAEHLAEIDRFAKMLSGEEGDPSREGLIQDHSRMLIDRKAQLFMIESAGIFAYGSHTTIGFKVGRGSLYRKSETPSLFRVYREERAEIERLGVVAKNAQGQWVFQRDHLFRAPGVAAMVTFGVAKSGNAWTSAPAPRILALMERHGLEAYHDDVAKFGVGSHQVLPAEPEGATLYEEEIGLRSRQLRDHALGSFSPDGRKAGENRWEGSASRVVHLTRAGQSPWKFQIRRDDLDWVLQDPDTLMTRSVIFVCGERGFVPVRAQDIHDLIAGNWAKGLTEKAYAVIGVKVRRGDQTDVTLSGTSRSLRNPVTLRE